MIIGPKDGYVKALCIKSQIFIDEVWGDCSVEKGKWYKVLVDHTMCTDEHLMVGFGEYPMINLVPYKRSMFKTEAELRDEKLNNIL